MDIASAFTFVFDDKEWLKKLAIGGGLALVAAIMTPVIVGLALTFPLDGYRLQVLKNVRDGQPLPLPEWNQFGDFFRMGLMVFIIRLVYNLPALLVACPLIAIYVATPFLELDPEFTSTLNLISIACWSCLLPLLALVGNALFPAALIRYAEQETLASAFQFREVFSFISSHLSDYVIALLLALVAGTIASFGFIICLVGVLFTNFWSVLVSANLYGQLAKEST